MWEDGEGVKAILVKLLGGEMNVIPRKLNLDKDGEIEYNSTFVVM